MVFKRTVHILGGWVFRPKQLAKNDLLGCRPQHKQQRSSS